MWPIWVTGMVVAAVVVVLLTAEVLDRARPSCDVLTESQNGFRRSISCGFEPDTGRFLFLSSAFRSLTVQQQHNFRRAHNRRKY